MESTKKKNFAVERIERICQFSEWFIVLSMIFNYVRHGLMRLTLNLFLSAPRFYFFFVLSPSSPLLPLYFLSPSPPHRVKLNFFLFRQIKRKKSVELLIKNLSKHFKPRQIFFKRENKKKQFGGKLAIGRREGGRRWTDGFRGVNVAI